MTLTAITAALVVTAGLGLSFRTTRPLGIAATAALCFVFPWLAVLVFIGGVTVAFVILKRR